MIHLIVVSGFLLLICIHVLAVVKIYARFKQETFRWLHITVNEIFTVTVQIIHIIPKFNFLSCFNNFIKLHSYSH